ncbi:hypothetical protein AAFF_G00213210 [Aldrovandia affinis]|uniref:Uncharacterized protein n=1 Tax=Aldrovandia affinis TaxID=143900 RepID=A0AAD7W4Z0_9TELE|nr:hypothetical protein AAFF_G00213210 [Aldrovandia affinis]
MSVSWIAASLLTFSLLAAANTGVSLKCIDMHTAIRRVTVNGSTQVRCPDVTGEVNYHLYRCEDLVVSVIRKHNFSMMENGVDFHDRDRNEPARFGLGQLTANSTGLYTCNAEILYPPPYVESQGTPHLVLVEEVPQRVQKCQAPGESFRSAMWMVWVWVALGMAVIYSLAITGLAIGFWQKQRNKLNIQHDYMNMKPRAKTKQGLRHPTRSGRY